MPWTSFGPWQSRIGPPGPEVAIFDDTWGHVGVTLEFILGTVGVFFDACRPQEPKKEARAGTLNQNRVFINFGICSMALRRVLAAAGALFSLWRPLANNGDFGLHFGIILGAPKLNHTHFGVSLSRFWVAKWGVF